MSKSCYVLELSVGPGGASRGELFVATDLNAIRQQLAKEFLSPDPQVRAEAALLSVWAGETIVIWLVRGGVLVGGVDLHSFLQLRLGGAPPIRLDDDATLDMLRQRFQDPMQLLQAGVPIGFELDWENLSRQVPPLEGAPLTPGEEIPLKRDVNQLRQHGSYLAMMDRLSLGFHDLAVGEEEPPAFNDAEEESPVPSTPEPPPPPPAAPPPPAPAGPAISVIESQGRLIARIPQERFSARLADQLKSRRREALQPGDGFDRKQQERLEREGCGFIAPLEFFSEVEVGGRPLDRKGFEAAAQELASGARGLQAQLPRFGTVLVLVWQGKRFITSELGLDPRVLEGWQG